jgi:hypothetical protein
VILPGLTVFADLPLNLTQATQSVGFTAPVTELSGKR